MTQANANPINFGTDSRLDLRKFHGTKIPHALNVTASLAQKFLSASSVKSLNLLSGTPRRYIFITHFSSNEEAFIRANYTIVPSRTADDLLRDYEAKMARLESQRHKYVDNDLPMADDNDDDFGGDW
jgi:hypothetical protein